MSPRYPTDDESNSDTRLTLTASVESNLSESSYLSYRVETDLFEPSFPSAAPRRTLPPVHGRGFIRTRAVPRGRGRARGGGCGDAAPGGFGNGYLPLDE